MWPWTTAPAPATSASSATPSVPFSVRVTSCSAGAARSGGDEGVPTLPPSAQCTTHAASTRKAALAPSGAGVYVVAMPASPHVTCPRLMDSDTCMPQPVSAPLSVSPVVVWV